MKINTIHSTEQLRAMVLAGERNWSQYGEVVATYWRDFVLFNYTAQAQFKPPQEWNWFELNSRGLILHANTGVVVARPFSKFWNYGQVAPLPGSFLMEVVEKCDGSLGILFRDGEDWQIATRGSFNSEQALWATEWLRQHKRFDSFDASWTLLFEILYPANRIVVDYHGYEGLVLIGARHMESGYELDEDALDLLAQAYGFRRPRTFRFDSAEAVLEAARTLSANEEGWVLRYSDGSRYKVKGSAYLLAHRLLTQCNFRHVLEAVRDGVYDKLVEGVPDEFLGQVKAWKAEIEDTVAHIHNTCAAALGSAPQNCSQKDFALWVQANWQPDFHAYLYAARAGKPLEPLIYKRAFENRTETPALSLSSE